MISRHLIEGADRDTQRPKHFDVVTFVRTVLVPIAIAIISTKADTAVARWLIALAVISVLWGLWPKIIRAMDESVGLWSDGRLATATAPRIRGLYIKFGEFMYSNQADSLHGVLSSGTVPAAASAVIRVGDQNVLYNWWHHQRRRAETGQATIAEVIQDLEGLCDLINAYKRSCFDPIFEYPTKEFLAALNPRAESKLEAAREKFNAFGDAVRAVTDQFAPKEARLSQRLLVDRVSPLQRNA